MCASAIFPVVIGSSPVTSVCGSCDPYSNSTSIPARNCSRSKRVQSTPIASPTRLASSVVVRRSSVTSSPFSAGWYRCLCTRDPNSSIEKQNVVLLDCAHRSARRLLDSGADLARDCVARFPRLAVCPERDPERPARFPISEHDVADVARLIAYAGMNDLAHDGRDILDSIRGRLEEVHSGL